MMPNKSIYRDADAAEINLYELNFARFFSIQTSENGWRRVVCELVRRAAKGTKELRLEDGTELPGKKTFPDYVVDLMDSYLAVLPDAKPHAYPAAEREQLPPRAEDLMLRAITLTARGCLSPLKAATLLPPFWSARGSARSTHRRFSPAKSGPRSPASMSTFAPKCQVQSWSRAFCTVLQGPIPQKNCRKWTMQAASRS